jgi:NADH-quinone oxidoreductase subunit J
MIETLIFLLFALLAVASSLVVVMHRNPVYSTMSLVVTLFSVAVLFVLLAAPFIAAIQILVYTGAILVLFLFVIMLLNITREESAVSQQKVQMGGALLGALLFGGMLALLFWSGSRPMDPITEELVSMKGLAREMFGEFLLPFEIVGMLLLVAVIGATVAARKPPRLEKPMEPTLEMEETEP